MKTLVTGAAGFIGSHLVELLLNDDHQVVAVDNFATGRPENLDAVQHHPALEQHQVDITDQELLKPLCDGVDWVFHLAALADIVPSIQSPMKYHHTNVDGTVAVLEAARSANVKRFVYSASSSCYGLPDEFPTPETAPASPMYPYALSKYLGEQCVMHWQQVYHIPCVSLRLFNVYGPRARASGTYGAVFGVFMAQKLAGQPFTVVGDGTQTRDFTFVTDVARAFVMAAASSCAGEIINIGSGATHSINKLVSLLKGEKIHLPKRPGEPDCTFAETSKVRRLLGWNPEISFEQGVNVMLENIQLWEGAPVWDADSIADATRYWFDLLDSPSTSKLGLPHD